jgi:hypothetical protein
MSKVQWIDRELIRNPLYIALCKTEDAFHRELRRLGIAKPEWPTFLKNEHADATVHHLVHAKTKRQLAIVCINKRAGRLRVEVDGLLVHEAVHIWQEIRDRIGERDPSPEFEAYAIQGIAQNLIAAYWNAQ